MDSKDWYNNTLEMQKAVLGLKDRHIVFMGREDDEDNGSGQRHAFLDVRGVTPAAHQAAHQQAKPLSQKQSRILEGEELLELMRQRVPPHSVVDSPDPPAPLDAGVTLPDHMRNMLVAVSERYPQPAAQKDEKQGETPRDIRAAQRSARRSRLGDHGAASPPPTCSGTSDLEVEELAMRGDESSGRQDRAAGVAEEAERAEPEPAAALAHELRSAAAAAAGPGPGHGRSEIESEDPKVPGAEVIEVDVGLEVDMAEEDPAPAPAPGGRVKGKRKITDDEVAPEIQEQKRLADEEYAWEVHADLEKSERRRHQEALDREIARGMEEEDIARVVAGLVSDHGADDADMDKDGSTVAILGSRADNDIGAEDEHARDSGVDSDGSDGTDDWLSEPESEAEPDIGDGGDQAATEGAASSAAAELGSGPRKTDGAASSASASVPAAAEVLTKLTADRLLRTWGSPIAPKVEVSRATVFVDQATWDEAAANRRIVGLHMTNEDGKNGIDSSGFLKALFLRLRADYGCPPGIAALFIFALLTHLALDVPLSEGVKFAVGKAIRHREALPDKLYGYIVADPRGVITPETLIYGKHYTFCAAPPRRAEEGSTGIEAAANVLASVAHGRTVRVEEMHASPIIRITSAHPLVRYLEVNSPEKVRDVKQKYLGLAEEQELPPSLAPELEIYARIELTLTWVDEQHKRDFRDCNHFNDDYLLTNTLADVDLVWCPCGANRDLQIKQSVQVSNAGSPTKQAIVMVDSTDLKSTTTFRLQWKWCQA
ncbi:hypothetical protein DFJ74DRAFT_703427 [Hyaloraphidium curvatum]|nr:hypothetical protein DFJ74DRAFT_703427 [Hyaloraphidium curvatum]